MPRSVPEWIAKHDDQAIPVRVKQRVFERYERKCGECGNDIVPGNGPEFDHKTPLADGGEHREGNLQPLCARPCHKAKTAREALGRAESRAKVRSAYGIKKAAPSPLAGARIKYSRARGCWVDRLTGEVVEVQQ